jgi:SAM-dependent methyltransferase
MTTLLPAEDRNFLNQAISAYLGNRPLFYAFIRPQETLLFHQHRYLIKSPILDFGCGDGFFAYQVFVHKAIDVGLDVRESRISESIQFPVYKKTVTYDGLTIPFPDNHFQTIISNCVFEHLPNLDKNLAEIYRVLKPGGYLLTTVMTHEWEKNLLGAKIFGDAYRRYFRIKQKHLNLHKQEQWLKVLNNAGLLPQKQIGYEGKQASQWNEICHYLAFPSLLSYKLFNQWVIWPNWFQFFRINLKILNLVDGDIFQNPSSAYFYIFRKPTI